MNQLFKENHRAQAAFPVRVPQCTFTIKQKYWFGGDPAMTHFFNAFQAFFPDLEMLMINAVRASKPKISDPQLLRDISAFIGQEAQHAAKHREFNACQTQRNQDDAIVRLEQFYARVHAWAEAHLSDRQRLALTLAFEHFTAMIGPIVMQHQDIIDGLQSAGPEVLWMGMWHAVEECEHKAVAFDAYVATGGGYTARAAAVLAMTPLGLGMLFGGLFYLMREDQQLTNWRSWLRFARFGFGRRGFAYQVFRQYPGWFRPGFHPNDHDTRAVEAFWKHRLGIPQPGMQLHNGDRTGVLQ